MHDNLKHKVRIFSPIQKIYEFCRGRETSLVQVALVSFISIVTYIISPTSLIIRTVEGFIDLVFRYLFNFNS